MGHLLHHGCLLLFKRFLVCLSLFLGISQYLNLLLNRIQLAFLLVDVFVNLGLELTVAELVLLYFLLL